LPESNALASSLSQPCISLLRAAVFDAKKAKIYRKTTRIAIALGLKIYKKKKGFVSLRMVAPEKV